MQAKIEPRVRDKFSTAEFERSISAFRKDVEDLKNEILDSASDEQLGQHASGLLREIEKSELGKSKGEFIQQGLPGTMMSRDTEALRQGMCIPAWLYYASVGLSAGSLADAATHVLRTAERFLKLDSGRPQNKPTAAPVSIGDLHPEIYQKCSDLFGKHAYPEAVEKGFKVVRDRLRKLTGHETGSEDSVKASYTYAGPPHQMWMMTSIMA